MSPKIATLIASSTASILAVVKLIVGIASGSVAVLASAIDSLLDVMISVFNFFALHQSEQPANKKFNYGYGKIQSLASLLEGVVIGISGSYILYEAVSKIISKEHILELHQTIGVMIFSLIVTALLVTFLFFMVKKSKNEVLQADLLHYKTDLLSNGAVLVSLGVVYFTGWQSVDAILGICVAIYVMYGAWGVAKRGILNLLDRSVDEELLEQIKLTLSSAPISSYHGLKSRISGNTLFLEVHFVFDEDISLLDAHNISDEIEENLSKLEQRLEWVILSHLDPYDDSLEEITA
ncbi:cation diffusion facilitator family transporter [Helicobacter pylori]